jgi:exportin-1
MPKIRGLRTIKKEILKLIDTYVHKADDLEMVNTNIVPPLLDAVLVDYNRNVPDARDAEVLNVMSTIITKLHVCWILLPLIDSGTPPLDLGKTADTEALQGMMEDKVPIIMENVFECTLEMINKDFSEYPEHRVEFFKLLRAINLFCFPGKPNYHLNEIRSSLTADLALLKLDNRQFKFVIDACMWASKHDNREVENAGLSMCIELLNNVAETDPQTSSAFFQQFFISILQDVFFVLTDTDHKAGKSSGKKLRQDHLLRGHRRIQISVDAVG